MTQLALVPKPCSLLTRGEIVDGDYKYRFECACGEVGEWVDSGPTAAGRWMDHAEARS